MPQHTPPRVGDDFSRGFGLFLQQNKRQAAAFRLLLMVAGCLWLAGFCGWLWHSQTWQAMRATLTWLWAAFLTHGVGAGDFGGWPVLTARGWEKWPPHAIASDAWFIAVKGEVLHSAGTAAGIATAESIVACVFLVWAFRRLGRDTRRAQHLRGQELVTDKRLATEVRRKELASDLAVGRVPLVKDSETQHTAFIGTSGSGKTSAILPLLDRIAARGEMAIVYDKGGTLLPLFFDEARGDIILNPLDERSLPWSPWAEMEMPADADRIAAALIPAGGDRDPFFADAARTLLATYVKHVAASDAPSMEQLLTLILRAGVTERRRLLEGSEAAKYLEEGGERTARSIEANLITYTKALKFLPAHAGKGHDFSFRQFIGEHADTRDGTPRPWIFLTSRESEHRAISPLLTCWIDCAVQAVLSLPARRERRVWLVLDELASLYSLPSLPVVLQEGRKFGAAVIVGLQNVTQLYERYGEHGARSVLANLNTKVLFRLSDPRSAEWGSDVIGQIELEHVKESTRYDLAGEKPQGVQITSQRHLTPLVLPAQIMKLPDLECIVRLPGDWPVARTVVPRSDSTHRTTRTAAFRLSAVSSTLDYALNHPPLTTKEPAPRRNLRLAAVDGGTPPEPTHGGGALARVPDGRMRNIAHFTEPDDVPRVKRDGVGCNAGAGEIVTFPTA